MDLTVAICKRLNVTPEQIINPRIENEQVVVVVDFGIEGSKKYRLPLDILDEPKPPKRARRKIKTEATDVAE